MEIFEKFNYFLAFPYFYLALKRWNFADNLDFKGKLQLNFS